MDVIVTTSWKVDGRGIVVPDRWIEKHKHRVRPSSKSDAIIFLTKNQALFYYDSKHVSVSPFFLWNKQSVRLCSGDGLWGFRSVYPCTDYFNGWRFQISFNPFHITYVCAYTSGGRGWWLDGGGGVIPTSPSPPPPQLCNTHILHRWAMALGMTSGW